MKKEEAPQASQQPPQDQEPKEPKQEKTDQSSSKLYNVALRVFEIFGKNKSDIRK